MSRETHAPIGFESPRPRLKERILALEVAASLGLAVSTLIAVTILTLGYAQADPVLTSVETGTLGVATVLGLFLVTMGGATLLAAIARPTRR